MQQTTFSSRSGRTAFTLIELLVVISIISLMISILLPALASARNAGRAVQCKSQIRQAGMAMQNYCVDNEGWTPDLFNYNPSGSVGYSGYEWHLNSYFGGSRTNKEAAKKILNCPSFENRRWLSYQTNRLTCGWGYTGSPLVQTGFISNIDLWPKPSKLFVLVEGTIQGPAGTLNHSFGYASKTGLDWDGWKRDSFLHYVNNSDNSSMDGKKHVIHGDNHVSEWNVSDITWPNPGNDARNPGGILIYN